MNKTLAIVMAGGMGERLQPLTRERSKASVPFAGKYRLIDLVLSNCINSGIRRIFVLTQYRSESLNRHIQEGWLISHSGLGDFIYTIPAQQKTGLDWYKGTADAVRQNVNLLSANDIEDVLILSGDHVYKMNYGKFLDFHRMKNATLTISAIRAKRIEAAKRLGVLETDQYSRAIGFEEKPEEPRVLSSDPEYCLGSMGIYFFRLKTIIEALKGPGMDFGREIIPSMIKDRHDIFVYDYGVENQIQDYEIRVSWGVREKVLVDRTNDSSYWKDVGTIDSFYEASMDLVNVAPAFSLYGEKWPLRTYQRQSPPSKCVIGGKVLESILSDGCIISGGTVERSVLSPGVIVERDAYVGESVIFDDVIVEPGARIRRAIVDKECKIRAGSSIGYDYEADKARGCTVTAGGIVVVPKGTEISLHQPTLL